MKLLTKSSSKTLKSLKYDITSYILYMAPHTLNTFKKNLCPSSTNECRQACLYSSGRGGFNSVQQARIKKSDYFISNLNSFKDDLFKEISNIVKYHKKHNSKFCIRLNGTTDILYENIKYDIDGKKLNIFEAFPDVVMYDYTKVLGRARKVLPKNYHLTYSYDGHKTKEITDLLNKGLGVSVVFKNTLPKTYLGYPVIDGDETDLRFLDRKIFKLKKNQGYIVGLRYKKNRIDKNFDINNSKFII